MTKRTFATLLKQKAYHTIKSRILLNVLRPGENLGENELSIEFGLSRTPIREILSQLENERLVKQIPYMGTFVTQLTKEDARELYEIRGALEVLAARTSVMRIPERELNDMELVYKRAVAEFNENSGLAASNEFRKLHDLIIAYAENRRLSMFIHSLDNESQRIISILYQSPEYTPIDPLNEKYRILLALRSRDTEKVIPLITEHYINSIQVAVSFLPSRSEIPENQITPFTPALLNSAFSYPLIK
ncbi:MAG: hypothetical protein A2029_10530 [Chloroflexi bacterium RBG_19FT_COMBO_47_9]|nr:MAG: hypothetical protein A2Y53_06310 [Chloroflexi bacterium RBG_16_47_49]OGO60740.1 MAG: hypothetical protein A2029_10530 [Chloroflexi bacterium RBG_19FT_COMBO_47_9]